VRLCNEEIRVKLADQVRIDVVKRFVQLEPSPYFSVDFPAGHAHIECRPGTRGQVPHPLGVVAFMRTTHQRITRAKRTDDLRSTGEE
jgi:hypothetical protein